ncbi:hypothetical protein Daura_19505 [Dactylosporangium aurantiacum]|uniref:Uncharacterized protein n=1 Tax=Dactylosporangium aurantiacum TaxID=35754 RepID=A0A9Q9IM29_9ACTN|nr:hypothetical protein [Dactylosporangium aurantiacum]MDG6106350.1 hypothetical protein [Dactylosporangium aurantiacum]UWZ58161.1 hypothetical protein Daura_19505 [Dactylosporangium aurantiacum]
MRAGGRAAYAVLALATGVALLGYVVFAQLAGRFTVRDEERLRAWVEGHLRGAA